MWTCSRSILFLHAINEEQQRSRTIHLPASRARAGYIGDVAKPYVYFSMSAIINTLRAALEAVPDSWEARLALVEALLNEDQREEAERVLDVVHELPVRLDERTKAARAYGMLDPAKGLYVIDGILEEQPMCAEAHLAKARICYQTGDIPSAQKHYFTAINFDASFTDELFAADLMGSSHDASSSGLPIGKPASESHSVNQENRVNVYYPAPGEFPVRTLREALNVPPIRPLVDPNTIPDLPELEYTPNPACVETFSTPEEVYREQFHNVHVVPRSDEMVIYDYQAPDDSIFEPGITPDDIYVGALVTETGEPVANFQETLRRGEEKSASKIANARQRDKVTSLSIGILTLGLTILILTLFIIQQPVKPPPLFKVAAVEVIDDTINQEQVQKPQQRNVPVSASAPPMNFLSATAASPVALPSLDLPAVDTGISGTGIGNSFGDSMMFGKPGGDGVMFMGSKTRGDMAVVFDITNSMYAATPVVVKEIKRAYRNTQVVSVFGGGFKREEFSGLVPFSENKKVMNIVDRYAQGKTTADVLKTLHSLKRSDSIDTKEGGDFRQSIGAGIEALLKQKVPPGTIFVFSDFADGLDAKYMKEIEQLVKRRKTKIVFWYPFNEPKPAWKKVRKQYEEFAKDTDGELREKELR